MNNIVSSELAENKNKTVSWQIKQWASNNMQIFSEVKTPRISKSGMKNLKELLFSPYVQNCNQLKNNILISILLFI